MAEGCCSYCDLPLDPTHRWDVDHVTERSRGGPHVRTNLVVACSRCNCVVLFQYPQQVAWRSRRPGGATWAARLGLTTLETFWERRSFVQAALRADGRPNGLASLATVQRRVAHLAPALVAFHNPS
ncbi:MAG: hypothetical protein ABS52_05940 [Gemmatimonadetes bacterium SCN 70-22]|nr:MAG: hypothetical protein ABS52_05940 [Gemmatimonadetes bacterium SCN 70-22]